jgi:hypothetical protein
VIVIAEEFGSWGWSGGGDGEETFYGSPTALELDVGGPRKELRQKPPFFGACFTGTQILVVVTLDYLYPHVILSIKQIYGCPLDCTG